MSGRIFIKTTYNLKTKLIGFFTFSILFNFNLYSATSIEAFGQSLHTVTKIRCNSCHATSVRPFHANPDVTTAHDAVVNNGLVDFTTTTNSKIYTKVKGGHNCWSGNCVNDSNTILNQINSWKTLMQVTSTPTPSPTSTGTGTGTTTTTTSTSASNNRLIAYKIYNRLSGIPPVSTVLNDLEVLVANGKVKEVANRAMDEATFYNVTLKNWVKPWTNVDRTNRVPLNDYVATVLGIIRDNIPFDQTIYGDHLYIAAPTTPGTIPAYDKKNNNHYQKLEDTGANLKDYLMRQSQSKVTGIKDTAGVLTTRAAGAAFFSAGTNRRATRYTFMNFMCRDFEALHDINIPDYHVRRDVDRKPGADSRTYKNKCVGCHAGQDALGGAFAYFDFVNGETTYNEGVVSAKINKNISFAEGWVTKDDSWVNTWAEGQNSNLGWPSKVNGNGVRELGVMLSRSRAFAECMSTRVYELVCLRSPVDEADKKEMRRLADVFQENANFNMKNLIAETAKSCIGE
jgi:hypothetical protein